jgi:uncharacterized secreted protein with C-terminal beta-propeller domain
VILPPLVFPAETINFETLYNFYSRLSRCKFLYNQSEKLFFQKMYKTAFNAFLGLLTKNKKIQQDYKKEDHCFKSFFCSEAVFLVVCDPSMNEL